MGLVRDGVEFPPMGLGVARLLMDQRRTAYMNARGALVTIVAALPGSGLKNSLLRLLGWSIGNNVHIGICLVFGVDRVDIGSGAYIGSFNVFRDLAALTLGEYAEICHWNWVTASRRLGEAGAPCRLHVGTHSNITARHYIDCSGGIRIGTHTAIAGERSTFLTHGISWKTNTHRFNSIEIGDYCLISSNVQIAPGTVIGSRVVVGMGATIAGKLLESGLYVQSRAVLVKSDLDGEYFRRGRGYVDEVETHA